MFYSDQLLQSKGPLARVWLASNLERKLSKNEFLRTNITSSVDAIVHNEAGPLALRVSGQLLLGVVKIYGRKTKYLLDDCNEAVLKLKMTFRPGNVDLPSGTTIGISSVLTLENAITDLDLAALPEPVLDLDFGNLKDFDLNLGQFDLTGLTSGLHAEINLPSFDESIEMARGMEHVEYEELARLSEGEEFHLDLGFEEAIPRAEIPSSPISMARHIAGILPLPGLGMDMGMEMALEEGDISVEVGREAPPGRPLAEELGDHAAFELPEVAMLEKAGLEEEEYEGLPELIPSEEEGPHTPIAIDLHEEGIPGLYAEMEARELAEGGITRRAPRAPSIKRARYDPITELRSSTIMAMQRDRSSIIKQYAQLSGDPFVANYHELSARPEKFLTSVVFNGSELDPVLASALNPERILEVLKRKRRLLEEPGAEIEGEQIIEEHLEVPEELITVAGEPLEEVPSPAVVFEEGGPPPQEEEMEFLAAEAEPYPPVISVPVELSQESVIESTQESEPEYMEIEAEAEETKKIISVVSKSTIDAVQFLRTKFESLEVTDESIAKTVSLDTIIEETSPNGISNRKTAVKMFFEMLVLATKDSVSLSQEETFGEIEVSPKNGLYASTWDTVQPL